jgi:SAM-dependent methyltransferase
MIPSDPENANHTPTEWDNWLHTSPGQYVLDWEENQFSKAVEDAFGFDALQIGLPQLSCLAANRITHRWQMLLPSQTFINHIANPQIHVICQSSIYDMPFENESLDLIALPHVLEFMESPHEALREVHRVLRPEGRIVISGFNPMSLWGLRQYSGKLLNHPFLPREGQFIGHRRIKDWLNLLNYSIDRGKFGCYGMPIKKNVRIQGPTFLDKVGDRWWPFLGSVFMLSAVKRTPAKRLVGLIKNTRPMISNVLKPATHSQNTSKRNNTNDEE